jgi:hypothetical protein
MVDDEFRKRAEARRARLTGGVARSFDELEEAGVAFWAQASYAAKLQATYDAIVEAAILRGPDEPAPRFDGSAWGILKLGS